MSACGEQVVGEFAGHDLIVVSNPLDAMAQAAFLPQAKFPRERVIGMAGILDRRGSGTFSRWSWMFRLRM